MMTRPIPRQTRLARRLAFLALLGASGLAHAQGFTIPELGARLNAMGTAIGRPDDLSAIYHNPAALTELQGTQVLVSMGAVFLNTSIRLHDWPGSDALLELPVDGEGYYPTVRPRFFGVVPMLAVSTNLWSEKLVGALGIYVPNAAGATFDAEGPTRYHLLDGYVVSAFTTLAVGYRPWRWLAVGLGVSAVYIRIHRRALLLPDLQGLNVAGLVGTRTELEIDGDDVQPAFHLGIQAWPLPGLSLGFMMLSRYDVSLEGPLRLEPGEDASALIKGNEDWTENAHRTEMVAPWIFAFGINWDVTRWLELGAEYRYYLNSLVEQQTTTITSGAVLKDLLPDGLVTPKNSFDSCHTGAGVRVRPPWPLALELMSGVHFTQRSSPLNTIEVGAPSFNILAYHLGARWEIARRYRIMASYAHYWYLEQKSEGSLISPPTNFIGVGTGHMLTVVLEARLGEGLGIGQPRRFGAIGSAP